MLPVGSLELKSPQLRYIVIEQNQRKARAALKVGGGNLSTDVNFSSFELPEFYSF